MGQGCLHEDELGRRMKTSPSCQLRLKTLKEKENSGPRNPLPPNIGFGEIKLNSKT